MLFDTNLLFLFQRDRATRTDLHRLWSAFEDADYSSVYQNLFTAIHDVKGVRPFEQSCEPWGRKCLLFPEYNAIFAKRHEGYVFPYKTNEDYVYDIQKNSFFCYSVEEKEALSAIALIKRAYNNLEEKIYSIRQMVLRSRISSSLFAETNIPVSKGILMIILQMLSMICIMVMSGQKMHVHQRQLSMPNGFMNG